MARSAAVDYSQVGSTPSEVRRMIRRAFIHAIEEEKSPPAIFLWGKPGEGKTFTTYSAAEDISEQLSKKVEVLPILTSTLDPCDISGPPFKSEDGRFCEYLPLRHLYELCKPDGPPAILLWDDLPASHPQTQAACFKVVHEGMIGVYRLRSNVMQIGAGNRVEDNAAAQDMPTALANRFRHVYFRSSVEDWDEWATLESSGIHPFVVAYLRNHKDKLNTFDPRSSEKAFASPRSWEMTSILMYEYGDLDDPTLTKAIAGTVGTGVAMEFDSFLNHARKCIPPEEIIKNPKKAKIPANEEIDALHATISSLEAHLRNNPKDWESVLIYCLRKEMLPELGVLLLRYVSRGVLKKLSREDRIKALNNSNFNSAHEMFGEYL